MQCFPSKVTHSKAVFCGYCDEIQVLRVKTCTAGSHSQDLNLILEATNRSFNISKCKAQR